MNVGWMLACNFLYSRLFDSLSLADNETKSKRMGYWVRQRLLYLYTCHMVSCSFSIIDKSLTFMRGSYHGL